MGKPPSPLRTQRLLLGYSIEAVAKAVNVEATKLSRAERGLRELQPDEVARLSNFYVAQAATASRQEPNHAA